MRVVAPFRPLPAEYDHHKALSDFDWMDAIRMMSESVRRACHCDVHVLTDVDTDLPMPALKYVTHHRRLMLWYLEVCACYLASADFDQDTVMLDSDQLIYDDLSRWFAPDVDLGVLVRELPPKDPNGFPILNGVQWWAFHAKDRLVAFYRQALAIAQELPEEQIAWGADTIALQRLVEPYAIGETVERLGLRVRQIEADDVIERLSGKLIRQLNAGVRIERSRAVLDFRNRRKPFMRPVFAATLGALVAG